MLAPLLPLLAAGGLAASGTSTVVVLTTESGPRGGFIDALRIQMTDVGKVETGPDIGTGTPARRMRRASEEVVRRGARAAVWIELGSKPDTQSTYIMHVVGRRRGKWTLEVRTLEARAGPAMERALALKVRDVLDSLLDSLDQQRPPQPITKAITGAGAFAGAPLLPTIRERTGLWLGLSARGDIGNGSPIAQVGGFAAFGLRIPRGRLALEPFVGVGFALGQTASGSAGSVDTDEVIGALGARGLTDRGPVQLGVGLDARLRYVAADGATTSGMTGSGSVVIPALGIAGEIRIVLTRKLALRGALAIEAATRRRRFSVNDTVLIDVGRVRAEAQLGLVVSVR